MRTSIFFLPVIALLSMAGCFYGSDIKELECVTKKVLTGNPSFSIGTKSEYIINKNTGEYYVYDEFTEGLKKLEGSGKDDEYGWEYSIKSTIAGNKWKKSEVVTNPISKDKGKSYTEIDLNSMVFTETNYEYDVSWNKVHSVNGICRWKKPKTTKLNEGN